MDNRTYIRMANSRLNFIIAGARPIYTLRRRLFQFQQRFSQFDWSSQAERINDFFYQFGICVLLFLFCVGPIPTY